MIAPSEAAIAATAKIRITPRLSSWREARVRTSASDAVTNRPAEAAI